MGVSIVPKPEWKREVTLETNHGLAACLTAIKARETTVRAWRHLDLQATASREGGPLSGLAVGVKDIIDAAGMPCSSGSPIYADRVPAHDAVCVAPLRDAGAVVLGKTVTTEFATFKPPATTNPHDPSRTPGGSSSGSAAAVAAGMARLALGSQTAGSVIRPAAFCGVVGFKPTWGLIRLDGVRALAPGLDTLGWFARSTADSARLAAVYGIETGPDGPPPRIALCRTPEWAQTEEATRTALDRALAVLADAGAETADFTMGAPFDRLNVAQDEIMWGEAARSLARECAEHPDLISDGLRRMLDRGAGLAPERVAAAHGYAADCRQREAELFGGADLLLSASAPGEAPARDTTGDPAFNRPWTLLHLPCLSLPFGAGPTGLPLGIQLIARRGDDSRLLAWARWAEAALS